MRSSDIASAYEAVHTTADLREKLLSLADSAAECGAPDEAPDRFFGVEINKKRGHGAIGAVCAMAAFAAVFAVIFAARAFTDKNTGLPEITEPAVLEAAVSETEIIYKTEPTVTETAAEKEHLADTEYITLFGHDYPIETTSINIEIGDSYNIAEISKLTGLKTLTVYGDDRKNYELTGTESISGLGDLETLELLNCNVNDLSFLENLENLKFLNLNNCTVRNELDFDLHKLNKLEKILIYNCGISDIGFLSGPENVKEIQVVRNNITDISALKDLPSLEWLALGENNISSASSFAVFPSIQRVSLNDNYISDVSSLAKSESIIELNLRGNNITDVSQFSQFKGLRSLDLSDNPVTDISGLTECKSLSALELSGSSIKDYSPIGELTGLTGLKIENTDRSDFSFVSKLTKLRRLELADNNISDISFLSELPVSCLILDNNNISDISPLYGINDRIDISPTISLYGNPIDPQTVRNFAAAITPANTVCVWFEEPYSSLGEPQAVKTVTVTGKEYPVDTENITIEINDSSPLVTDVSALSKFKNLKSLDIYYIGDGGPYCVKGLNALEGCETITSVSIEIGLENKDEIHVFETMLNLKVFNFYGISGYEDFEFDMPQLEELSLLGWFELSRITHLKNLKGLSMIYNDRKGTDLQPIAELPQLESLYIEECGFEDYTPLLELENLEYLWISSYPMTEEMYNKICAKFPDCKITVVNDFIKEAAAA